MNLDNVVQNVNISAIIPPKEQLVLDNEVQKLIDSIREDGILEPLLLRPVNNKYEVIIGNKRYEIAKILGLKTVPALIKELDDEVVQQYKMINNFDKKNKTSKNTKNTNNEQNNQSGKFINIPNVQNNQIKEEFNQQENIQNFSNNNIDISNFNNHQIENTYDRINRETKKSDIINLSELNKEYEREDLKMNNNQMNNMPNNNMGMNSNSAPQEPTFGGRFFPSLEDEPTNMTMGSINVPNQNNNLIDLTDMGSEKINTSQVPPQNVINTPNLENNSQFNIGQKQEQLNPIPSPVSVDNMVNVDKLQPNNQSFENYTIQNETQNIPPVYNQQQSEIQNMSQPSLNDTVSPILEQNPINNQQSKVDYQPPQYDMTKSISSNEVSLNQETIPQNNSSMLSQNSFSQQPQMSELINNSIPTPVQSEIASNPSMMNIQNNSSQKDLNPVLNTLKNMAINLESFGYKLSVSEENLENSVKLIIEVEK